MTKFVDDGVRMQKRRVVRRGRISTMERVPWRDGEDAGFRFWYDGLTPKQRVEAVGQALANA